MPNKTKGKKEERLKTYKERADYLSFVQPYRTEIYQCIANFFGHDEIPPKFKIIK